MQETPLVLHRRFDRMGRLVGDNVMHELKKTHVMVIGLGGVGSWCAESLMRSGIGKLSLVDFDDICITNVNRQLHALQGMIGQKKANVLAERMKKINPQAEVVSIPQFYQESSSEEILSSKPYYIIDAIDNLKAKSHLINTCREKNIPFITSTGAAARLDPLQIKITDLVDTHTDPMAQQLRKILRTKYDFPEKGPWGVPCVFSEEKPLLPEELEYDKGEGFKCVCPQGQNDLHSCTHRSVIYGTASFVTGAFGLAMSSWVVKELIRKVEAPK